MDFLHKEKSLLTVILQCANPETAIGRIRNANHLGAEAYGLQVESLLPEYQNPETYTAIFKAMKKMPVYVTNYRKKSNAGKSDEELAEGLLELADCGAHICDVMGDMFDPQPDELAKDETAIQRQMELIDKLHAKGAKVLMSSHVLKFIPADRVLEIAMEHKKRGADVSKIVVESGNMEEQIENLRITNLLKEKLDIPFLFLSGGQGEIQRRLGWKLGNCMTLCVYEHDAFSTPAQPLLTTMKTIIDGCLGF